MRVPLLLRQLVLLQFLVFVGLLLLPLGAPSSSAHHRPVTGPCCWLDCTAA
jgi:hypothetical protein